MPALTEPATAPDRVAALRHEAAARLTGTAATKGATARAADALTVLHALASSPATAPDALALLHELQVHQVELDLQAQELQESRAELESALRRQTEIYDGLPVGCFTIDTRLALDEFNAAGADLLGITADDAPRLTLDTFLGADGTARLRSVMARVDAGDRSASCRVAVRTRQGPDSPVLASVARDRAAQRYLLTLAPLSGEPGG